MISRSIGMRNGIWMSDNRNWISESRMQHRERISHSLCRVFESPLFSIYQLPQCDMI